MHQRDLKLIPNEIKIKHYSNTRLDATEDHCLTHPGAGSSPNFVNNVGGLNIEVLTVAFILSLGNVLSKNPYMSQIYEMPLHCILYFLLGLLLSYMCLKRIQKCPSFYRDLLIVCLIFISISSFFFFQVTYHDEILHLYIRLALSAGIGVMFVCLYSLHVYYENKDLAKKITS